MFGNLSTNAHIARLIATNAIQIDPFDDDALKATHYTLHFGRILESDGDGSWKQIHNFRDEKVDYLLEESTYVVVEVFEAVRFKSEGIVGRFIPASNLIESGLGLTAGQIDGLYGSKGEWIRFGLKNLTSRPVRISRGMRVAHLEIFDIRGMQLHRVKLTQAEVEIRGTRRTRRMEDDGIDYGDGS